MFWPPNPLIPSSFCPPTPLKGGYSLYTSIECTSILAVYPLPLKRGSKTAIVLAPFRGLGVKKEE